MEGLTSASTHVATNVLIIQTKNPSDRDVAAFRRRFSRRSVILDAARSALNEARQTFNTGLSLNRVSPSP